MFKFIIGLIVGCFLGFFGGLVSLIATAIILEDINENPRDTDK